MGRVGWLLSLLCCLLLGAALPGDAVEEPSEKASLTLPTPSYILPVSLESEFDLSVGTTSPPMSSASKDLVLSGTSAPEEVINTTEAAAGTEGPESEEDSSNKPAATVVSSRGDVPVKVHGNSTAMNATATDVFPTDLSVTVEVVQTTQSRSSPPPRHDAATLAVAQMVPSTISEPTSSQGNLIEDSTQSPSEEGLSLQNVTEFGNVTKALYVVTATNSTVLTFTITEVTTTTAASTTLISSAEPTSKEVSEDGKHESSVLDVGDDRQAVPSVSNHALSNTDPLVVAVISVFLVMVAILAVIGFLRYRQRNNRTDFRRLQDLPMDDMMEDTPLSLYSY